MDGGLKSERKFPGHTTAELKESVKLYKVHNPALALGMELEIERREAGLSKAFVTPQIKPASD